MFKAVLNLQGEKASENGVSRLHNIPINAL
jgi:hypothetical protein